jgi:predicted dehydrogenase
VPAIRFKERRGRVAGRSLPINVGVVGLGSFGSHHARQYAANPSARLVAVADTDTGRACAAAQAYGVEVASDYRALIGKIDAVSITVPAADHHAVARDFLDAGVHVFIEKPLAVDAAEAGDLVARARKGGAILQVGHIERFSPVFRTLKEKVRAPRLMEFTRRTPWTGRSTDVDVVLDLMIHDIDLALTLAAFPAVAVEASGVPVSTPLTDVAEARVTFANGIVATLAASRVAAKGERVVRVTERGRALIADFAALSLTIIAEADGSLRSETVPLNRSDSLAAEIADFLDCIATGKPPLVGGEAGLDAVKVADMIRAAIAEGAAAPLSPDRRARIE